MPYFKQKLGRDYEEARIQQDIITFLVNRDWMVRSTHGNMYASGWPDLYCYHKSYGERWIEVKKPSGFCFTKAQIEDFPKFTKNGCGIWILTQATEEEYQKLWKPANWIFYYYMTNPEACK